MSTEADELKARIATANERITKGNEVLALSRLGKFTAAARVADLLGEPMPRGQVVRFERPSPRS